MRSAAMRARILGMALAAALGAACARPPAPPPPGIARTTIAVLPPDNRTGVDLVIAGGSVLDEYVFHTEKVTVAEALLAETRTVLLRRGYPIADGDAVVTALRGAVPRNAAEAEQLAARADLGGAALYLAIRQWTPDDATQPRSIIASLEAALVDARSGDVLWRAAFGPRPVPTPGAIDLGTASMIAIRTLVADLFASWPPTGPA